MEIASVDLTAHLLLEPQEGGGWIGEVVGPGLVGVNRHLRFAPGVLERFARALPGLRRGELTLAASEPGAFDVRLQVEGARVWVYVQMAKREGGFTHTLATRFVADPETLVSAAEEILGSSGLDRLGAGASPSPPRERSWRGAAPISPLGEM